MIEQMMDWSEFEKMPGAATHNFEVLCRSAVWINYNRFGKFKALANQAGIEFDLQLEEDCAIGTEGRWFGWQCRWWDLPGGRAIGNTRRRKIEDALLKTHAANREITDWVLWTRHPLTNSDQEWFYSLETDFRLHLWSSYNLETLLTGEAEILKETYFGNLILTSSRLSELREEAIATIRTRWLPDVHQTVQAERSVRRILAEPASWEELLQVADRLTRASTLLYESLGQVPNQLTDGVSQFMSTLTKLRNSLEQCHGLLLTGDLELLQEALRQRATFINKETSGVTRKLRGARLLSGLVATNALADMTKSVQLLNDVARQITMGIVAVVAEAGGGKTQISAELTAPRESRPPGILLFGRNLSRGRTLDDLANGIVLRGQRVASFRALMAAVNSFAERAKCRLPIVIDGLNEAEDPRQWKALLASIETSLHRFPNVLLVCTLRSGLNHFEESEGRYRHESNPQPSFIDQALPSNISIFEIPDFQEDSEEAITKYFDFFRIKVDINDQPLGLLSHPLTLRIFCEVTNPNRSNDVGMEAVPRSLAAMFERYIWQAAQRVEEISSSIGRIYQHDVIRCLDTIGYRLWESKSRALSEIELRREIADDRRDWHLSIITLLQQEGILLRVPGVLPGSESIIPAYDLLGGYLVASSLVSRFGRLSIGSWLAEKATDDSFRGEYDVRHPLAQDVFRFLAALVPRRLMQQLWQLVEEPLRTYALELATLLEGRYLDKETTEAMSRRIRESPSSAARFFPRLVDVRSTTYHPLNAYFLDSVLIEMGVAERDLLWTEWIRKNERKLLDDLVKSIDFWREHRDSRSGSDTLKAVWIMWLLTSTSHRLRDTATLALYWFGRGDGAAMFILVEHAVKVNDPYVLERVMAASYGAAMGLAIGSEARQFVEEVLPEYALRFYQLFFEKDAPFRTTHMLTRDYARHFLELANKYKRDLFSSDQLLRIRPPYSDGGRINWGKIKRRKPDQERGESPFRMDFENYTLGRLVKGRRNYDNDNKEYMTVRSRVLWRIEELGWSSEKFGKIEDDIESGKRSFNRHDNDVNKVDRYGKKYSWISYFELGGWLQDRRKGRFDDEEDDRVMDIDIDPTFPDPVLERKLIDDDLLGSAQVENGLWINAASFPDISIYFRQHSIADEDGPWAMLDGYISQEDKRKGRSVFANVRSFFVANEEREELISYLKKEDLENYRLPHKQGVHHTFAGEVPWCDTFPALDDVDIEVKSGERKVKLKKKDYRFFLNDEVFNPTYFDLMRLSGKDFFPSLGRTDSDLSDDEIKDVKVKVKLIDFEQIVPEYRVFRLIQPACDISMPGYNLHNTTPSGTTLSKRISNILNLVNIPQTFDLQNATGERATIQFRYATKFPHVTENFFFIRESLLQKILDELDMSLIRVVSGGLEITTRKNTNIQLTEDRPTRPYMDFRLIYPEN